ncbi:hypothetical protein K435DRAFT_743269 [Dendrothele bispora CBS 962.96]|uniref:U3 small nucleolar RNA-associated protein 6 N-terminal domain-containing protein n=1 Tax=Dendrothele bispora (strain CBS 962.96) TaxID=1314807 RepID=A0A4S8MUT0_DENBC|nr:hypothetical protein K435DRAFT_743269 [Dendrothele bispora CBS 962.96]
MERVQFEQEQMLDELKDLVEKKLFTVKETKQILKQRTQYEAALVRRVAKKADFLRYAQYEMSLEQLRRKRAERLKIKSSPQTISDYALVRRQFNIFERALKRFKSDVGLWIEYISLAKKEGARTLVGRITARALQLHPNVPALYILAASHELDHLSPSSARSLLQRGIRMNGESVEMWREYVKMELGFMESMRRRWETLGISGESSAQEVMAGAVVTAVISKAVQALDNKQLVLELDELITSFPMPDRVRQSLLQHLYRQAPVHAARLIVERSPNVEGVAQAHELIVAANVSPQEYRELTSEWTLHVQT